jgi:hypothetical protein
MWPIAGLSDGSFYFDNQPNVVDQFWPTRTWPSATPPIKVDPATVLIFKLPAMVNPDV